MSKWLCGEYGEFVSLMDGVIPTGLLPDRAIRSLCGDGDGGMIEPFVGEQRNDGVISYGLSSYGYDIRIADEFKVFTPGKGDLAVVDPKAFDDGALVDWTGDTCIIPPNSFVLGRSVEYLRMPRDVLGLVLGKSTYARVGIVTNFTPLEPGWEGHITIEISNTTPLPAIIYANEGIAQVLFFRSAQPDVSYADRKGKYQGQRGVTTARVERCR